MFDELQDVDAAVLLGYVQRQHRHRVLAVDGPAADVRQLQGVHAQTLIGHARPLVRLEQLELESRRELTGDVGRGVSQGGALDVSLGLNFYTLLFLYSRSTVIITNHRMCVKPKKGSTEYHLHDTNRSHKQSKRML